MKKIFLLFLLFAIISLPVSAQIFGNKFPVEKFNMALKVGVSTNGVGGDLVFQFMDQFALRVGGEYLSIPYKLNTTQSGITLTANSRSTGGGVNAFIDIYFLRWLYLSAGAGVSFFGTNVNIVPNEVKYGDIILPPSMVGNLTLDVKPGAAVTPYLGIGFGRTIPAKNKKPVSFSAEIGCFYIGSPKATVVATGMLEPNGSEEQIANYNQILSRYKFLPSIKLGLSIMLFRAK